MDRPVRRGIRDHEFAFDGPRHPAATGRAGRRHGAGRSTNRCSRKTQPFWQRPFANRVMRPEARPYSFSRHSTVRSATRSARARGDAIGPDLSKLGKETTDAYLIESVLQPSKVDQEGV